MKLWKASKELVEEEAENDDEDPEFGLGDVKDASKISISIGYSLVPLVDEGKAENLSS